MKHNKKHIILFQFSYCALNFSQQEFLLVIQKAMQTLSNVIRCRNKSFKSNSNNLVLVM